MSVLNGVPLDKDDATVSQMLKSDTQMRIIENALVPNTLGSPSIEDYIALEEDDGYGVTILNNTMIVTKT